MSNKAIEKWQLETNGSHGDPMITPITRNPFNIGRKEDCELRLPCDTISRLHAQITLTDAGIRIKDCGSTNGTFVNFQRITAEHPLKVGDVVHFAGIEYRVGQAEDINVDPDRTSLADTYVERLEFLISNRAVIPHFQPIVRLQDNQLVAYELLGRVACEGVPSNIPQLFTIAKRQGREAELSLMFRDAGFAQVLASQGNGLFFFNTVPKEMDLDKLHVSLTALRNKAPHLGLAMEVHETAVTDVDSIRKLKEILKPLNIKLVYDDFGAGQSRLLELMEAPPDVLKFDIALISNIHQRPEPSQRMLGTLVAMARELGVVALAEGVETAEEAEFCRQLGFQLAQGYFFGKPAPTLR